MAEFDDATELVAAANARARSGLPATMDAYSPFPIEELHRRARLQRPSCR